MTSNEWVGVLLLVLGIGIGYNLHAMAFERMRLRSGDERPKRRK